MADLFDTRLLDANIVADRTMEFRFEKPVGFAHAAGQSMDVILIDPPFTDEKGNSRSFSIASAPHEEDLRIAVRMRDSAFKRSLADLPWGTYARIEGPFGRGGLREEEVRPTVFLAGGIGITPFRAMMFDAAHRDLPHRILLLYANRRPADAAYLSEITDLCASKPQFAMVATMTSTEEDDWQGRRGYIDRAMIEKHISLGSKPVFHIAGPMRMADAMRRMLTESGVHHSDILVEEFAGY